MRLSCDAYVRRRQVLDFCLLVLDEYIGMNKREQREGVYKHVKEEIVSSSESSYYSIKRAQGKKQELNLGKKKAEESKKNKKSMKKKKKVDSDLEEGTSSLIPEFSITIRKSHLVFLVR